MIAERRLHSTSYLCLDSGISIITGPQQPPGAFTLDRATRHNPPRIHQDLHLILHSVYAPLHQ
ncbi:hypothetical protein BDV40DRAFT_251368 [Aspergillus tamarii]|uniref:Uncharacterized protein n=1 Tax=Aspergillus tamarii TaxID=41984 RepID=A0A5N6VAU2_ASPTM|nr:hypothetical protein BDV40DRAFT_251368 [Aspergillus tamarii]